jgi:hypothetical protein
MPQEQTKVQPAAKITGIITALLLFLCILSVAYYTYLKSNDPSLSPQDFLKKFEFTGKVTVAEAKVLNKFDYDIKEDPGFAVFDEYIAKCGSGGLSLIDRSGKAVWSESMALNKPLLKTNGSQLLAADIGGLDICVSGKKNIRWKDKLDEAILNADISKDGYVTVITSSKRYNNEIRVFDPHGIELFRKIIASDFAVSASVAPSDAMLAVSGISTGAAGAYSDYKFYDFLGNDPVIQSFGASGKLFPVFWFTPSGKLFAAGDKEAACIDKSGKVLWEKQFKSVLGACLSGKRSLAVAEENNGGIWLERYAENGEKLASGAVEGKPDGISAANGTIAVYTFDTVYFYNDRCQLIARFSTGSRIHQVNFFNNRQAAVVTVDSVTVVNIG